MAFIKAVVTRCPRIDWEGNAEAQEKGRSGEHKKKIDIIQQWQVGLKLGKPSWVHLKQKSPSGRKKRCRAKTSGMG